jgi:prepilin-type N-terminal cleavage/methylation domain-containing protein
MIVDRPRRHAFTLIELLVTIGIIATLIGILIPVIGKVRKAAYGASTSAQLSKIATAITAYHSDFRAYPGPLPNNWLGYQYYTFPTAPPAQPPYWIDPSGNADQLQLATSNTTPPSVTNFPQPNTITGAENLVLGLCGGLELNTAGGYTFEYNPWVIFPDGINPGPKGASSLNYAKPKRSQAYVDLRPGEISHPDISNGGNNGQFTDEASRKAQDSVIPEFVDQYPEGLPIIYIRANAGGTAVCGIGGKDDINGNALMDPTTNQTVVPQYDLSGVLEYTLNSMSGGVSGPIGIKPTQYHGLQGLNGGNPNTYFTDTIDSAYKGYNGKNAIAYFKDPTNPGNTTSTNANTHGGNARQRDGYILISPGPDRIYGTSDDIIYPGTLNP